MRLFAAAELPADIRARLAAAAPGPPWRAVHVDDLHVTLAFLGERPEADVPVVAGVLDACAGIVPAADLGECVLLPPERPRVCAIGVISGGLKAIQRCVAARLAEAGVHTPERRPYLPHVTIARVRGRAPRTEVSVPGAFGFASIALYASRPDAGKPRYTVLHRSTLQE